MLMREISLFGRYRKSANSLPVPGGRGRGGKGAVVCSVMGRKRASPLPAHLSHGSKSIRSFDRSYDIMSFAAGCCLPLATSTSIDCCGLTGL